jgi:SsrA-binding protein
MDFQKNVNIRNKKVSFDYEIIDRYVAGIKLTGTEIKSIRLGKASLVDTYCFFKDRELWLKSLDISEYVYGTHYNHETKRDRKLLLNRSELTKLERKVKEKGFTIVASRLFINEKGLAKVEIALAKGKKEFDHRDDIKQRDANREMARARKVR